MSSVFYMISVVTMVICMCHTNIADEVSAIVSCANDRFTIHVNSNGLQIGKVYVEGKKESCNNKDTPVNNIGTFTLILTDKGAECGAVQEDGKYKVIVRSESYTTDPSGDIPLINPQVDKRWEIVCDFQGLEDGVVNRIFTQFQVSGDLPIESEQILQPSEDVVMELIELETGEVATEGKTLKLGTLVQLRISLTPSETAKGIQMRARCNMTDNADQTYLLTTSEGCAMPSNMLFKDPWVVHNYTTITSPQFQLPKFTSSDYLQFICSVKYCPVENEAECLNAAICGGGGSRKKREAENTTKPESKSDDISTRVRVTMGEPGLVLCDPACECFKKVDVIASLVILGSLLLLTTATCLACVFRYRTPYTSKNNNHGQPNESMSQSSVTKIRKNDHGRSSDGSCDPRSRRSTPLSYQSYERNSDLRFDDTRGYPRY